MKNNLDNIRMKFFISQFICILLFTTTILAGEVNDPSKMSVGDWCKFSILNTHPTQMAFGKKVVEDKIRKFQNLSKEELKQYLIKNKVPVVRAPNGSYFMIDRHHQTIAAFKVSRENHYVQLFQDLSKLPDMNSFWAEMIKLKLVWLFDEKGNGPHSPNDLPQEIRQMKNDPYRSLADAVQEKGGFEKRPVPFQEFIWAQFFRDKIKIDEGEIGFKKAIADAMKLSCDQSAKYLPGYKKSCFHFLKF